MTTQDQASAYTGGSIVYRPMWGIVTRALVSLLAIGLAVKLDLLETAQGKAAPWTATLLDLALVAGGAAGLVSAALMKIILTRDAIEAHGLFGARRMERSDIDGYRLAYRSRQRDLLLLYPKQDGAWPIRLDPGVLTNPRTRAWFEDVASLTVANAQRTEAEIDACQALGDTPEARRAKARKLGFNLLWMLLGGLVLLVVIIVAGFPSLWLVCLMLAFLAVSLGFIFHTRDLPMPLDGAARKGGGLAMRTVLPMIGPIFATFFLGGLIRPASVNDFGTAIGVAATLSALLMLVIGGSRVLLAPKPFLVAAAFCAFGLYGVVMSADAAFDFSTPRVQSGPVTGRHLGSGKGTSYWVDVALPSGTESISTPSRIYDRLEVGRRACLSYRPGALQVAWYWFDACPGQVK
jgi:hypothetical protein